ncbi:MAG: redox-regulated ATPase YchF [Deltaproteobacteria bacterium]|nr:redox-regulated ATPase YchF [Deltaproteobacteria bacterium]
MGLKVGIVGLPNVGKSTLFNAVSATARAEAANFPFCTIDPNIGVAPVPDGRFDALVELYKPEKVVRATVDFVDIAGLVRGASQGEGRGNAFLSHIREVDAIAHVVRCFDDDNILHVDDRVNPAADVETIETELLLKDLETVQKRLERARKQAKGARPEDRLAVEVLEQLERGMDQGRTAHAIPLSDEGRAVARELFLLTDKPLFFVANVAEADARGDGNAHLRALEALAAARGVPVVRISAAIEAEIAGLPAEDRPDFLASVGLTEPGLHQVVRTGYQVLELLTFFTAGKPEVHAWPLRRGTRAPGAAGKIHTDFERGFIKAEVIHWKDLVDLGSEAACRAAGKLAIEGKDYVMRDGDVVHFRFNV